MLTKQDANALSIIYKNTSKLTGDKKEKFISSVQNLLNQYLDKDSLSKPLQLIIGILENDKRFKAFFSDDHPEFKTKQFRYTDKDSQTYFAVLSSRTERKEEKTVRPDEEKTTRSSLIKEGV